VKKGGGKRKGGAFEREMCRALSLLVTKGKRDDVFWRTDSGARQTQAAKGKKAVALSHVAGDVVAVHELGYAFVAHWYVEMKSYRNLQLPQFILNGEGFIAKVWDDTCVKSSRLRKSPMLILKQNQFRPFVVMTWKQARPLVDTGGILATIPARGLVFTSLGKLKLDGF